MAEKIVRRGKSGSKKTDLPFRKSNYMLFFIAVAIIFLGYFALAQGPADNFWSLTLAPILLVIGYCVLIPIAIIYTGKSQP